MKLTSIFLLAACIQISAAGYGQRISISGQNMSLKKVFGEIQKQTGYSFLYFDKDLEAAKKISIDAQDAELIQVLNQVFKGQPLTYTLIDKTVVIKQKQEPPKKDEEISITLKIDIEGFVTNENNEPLAGASVIIKGTKRGTTTDNQGRFRLTQGDEKAILVISFVGYENLERPVSGSGNISVQLKQSVSSLNELVTIGYGTTTKRKSTGSVSSITSREIEKQPVGNVLNALQGRVAGAFVTQASGLPGGKVTINIRGIGALDPSIGNQPLYIIDGVPFMMNTGLPIEEVNVYGIIAANGRISPFSVINPNDIERIDVLKDADATAIYGTRGANGVVLITTKKGKSGKTKLDINVYQGKGSVPHFIPMMNTAQYRQMRKEAFANDGLTPTVANAPDLMLWDSTANTNWQEKYIGGTANISDAQATITGGDQRTRFLFNAGYRRETTVFPGDFSDNRISTRLNVDHNSLDRKFNASISVNYSYNKSNLLQQDLSTIFNLPPNMPLHNADGSLLWNANFTNPESYQLVKYFGKTNNMITNTVLRYTLLPGLDIKASFGYNDLIMEQNQQYPALSRNPLTTVPTNSADFATIRQKSYIAEPQLTYSKDLFGGKFSALLGSSFQNSVNTTDYIYANNYSTAALLGTPSGAGTYDPPFFKYIQYRYNSVFTRLNYDWGSKYLFNAVLRRDGSSRFGPGKRFGNFWSLGAAWVFTNEKFTDNLSFLSFGKLRSSYGKTGNDNLEDYSYRTLFTSQPIYQNSPAFAPNRVDNPLLHWQTTYKMEFGLDLGFLKDRLLLTTNYYVARTPNQLGPVMLASPTGFNNFRGNFDALIRNSGFELELNTVNVQRKDFTWKTSFNLTVPRNIVVRTSPTYFNASLINPGQHQTSVLAYQFRGLDLATGRPLYTDVRKDSLTFTPSLTFDRFISGHTAPDAYGGLNNAFSYKNFEFSFFFQFTKQGGQTRRNSFPGLLSSTSLGGNQVQFYLDAWHKPGDGASIPRYSTNTSTYLPYIQSDAMWGDVSFIRLRNINLSYTLPQNITGKMKLQGARLYLQAQNVAWWSKLKYVYDPESFVAMPPLRVITAGINVTL